MDNRAAVRDFLTAGRDRPSPQQLTLIVYTVEPISPAEQALAPLGSWTDEHRHLQRHDSQGER